jgi:plasmid maintenance system antidote protein VapI
MSDPRYRPRDFAVYSRDFARKPVIEWKQPSPEWSPREVSQLRASQLQHRLCYGVLEVWMPRSPTRKMTTLSAVLGVPYGRLQRVLTGHTVMQFEDFGRLYEHIGPLMELWLLSGRNAEMAQAISNVRKRDAEAAAKRAASASA